MSDSSGGAAKQTRPASYASRFNALQKRTRFDGRLKLDKRLDKCGQGFNSRLPLSDSSFFVGVEANGKESAFYDALGQPQSSTLDMEQTIKGPP